MNNNSSISNSTLENISRKRLTWIDVVKGLAIFLVVLGHFSYSKDGTEFTVLGGGESQYLSTEAGGCFTGNVIGLYASGNGKEAKQDAYVTKFTYKAVK